MIRQPEQHQSLCGAETARHLSEKSLLQNSDRCANSTAPGAQAGAGRGCGSNNLSRQLAVKAATPNI
ncbi:MAG: hypothetical protein ACJ8AW_33075, partial [Rhodopila sp.]